MDKTFEQLEAERLLSQVALTAIRNSPKYPFDTGNLKYAATYVGDEGLSIIFDMQKASYIEFLEYGTAKSKKHVGFIERALDDATNQIAEYTGGKIVD